MEKNNNQKQNKYKKYKIYIIISVLILIFSIGIALFYLSINKKPYNKNTNTTIKTSTPAPTQPEPRENEKIVLWEDIVNQWIAGTPLELPADVIKNNFLYETTVCTINMKSPYNAWFVIDNALPNAQDHTKFDIYINQNTDNKYVISFLSNSGNRLVIPMPQNNKNFATIQLFMQNAENQQKIAFWKKAGEIIKEEALKSNIYISTHGRGVPYFHLRIEKNPTYYKTNRNLVDDYILKKQKILNNSII
jgi:hypothetical protein